MFCCTHTERETGTEEAFIHSNPFVVLLSTVCGRSTSHQFRHNTKKTHCRSLPEHVQDLPSRVYAHQHVWHRHVLELGVLGVGEVHLRLPDGLDQVGVVEVQRLHQLRVVEARVGPVLPQVEVHLVVLQLSKRGACTTTVLQKVLDTHEGKWGQFVPFPFPSRLP